MLTRTPASRSEERPDPGDHVLGGELGSVAQGAAHAAHRDGADHRLLVLQGIQQRGHGAGHAQPGERIEGVPAARDVGVPGVADERGHRRPGAEAPRVEQRRALHRRRRHACGRAQAQQLAQRTCTVVAPDPRERGHGLGLGRPLRGRGHGTHQREQGRDRARLLQQAQPEGGGRRDALVRIAERLHQGVDRCGIADPPGGERRLAPHHGLGVPERFTEQRRIEGAGIRCGEDPRELAHERLVRLLRGGAAAAERRCTEQDDDATSGPDQGSA